MRTHTDTPVHVYVLVLGVVYGIKLNTRRICIDVYKHMSALMFPCNLCVRMLLMPCARAGTSQYRCYNVCLNVMLYCMHYLHANTWHESFMCVELRNMFDGVISSSQSKGWFDMLQYVMRHGHACK